MDKGNLKDQQTQFILNGRIVDVMIQLSWPAVIAMVMYGFNTVLDGIFIGRFVGEEALAGVSLVYPLTQICTALGSLIGVGAGSVLSIAIGSKNVSVQRKVLGSVNVLTVLCTIVYMIFAITFTEQLISVMGGSRETLALGSEYFRITIFGSLFWIYGLTGNMIIRAEGKMKTAAWMMGLGLLVNAFCNYLFIVLLNQGIAGAAYGTNIGMVVYTLVSWFYFAKGKPTFEANVFSFKPDKSIIKDILSLGMSSLMMSIMNLIQAVVVFNALVRYGTTADVAFYGVVYRIFQFLLTPIFGLMRALQPAIGINFGAGKYDRVIRSYKAFAMGATILTLPFWVLSLVSPQLILNLMLPNQLFSSSDILYLRVQMVLLPVMSFIFMAMTLFPAVGKGKPAMILGLTRQFVFYVPVMLLLPRWLGVGGVYFGSFAIDAVIVLGTLFMVRKEFNFLRENNKNFPLHSEPFTE